MAGGERRPDTAMADRSEQFGERLLGVLLDRAHELAPQLIAPLVAQQVEMMGGRDVSILLQDYGQRVLAPLSGRRLVAGEPEPISDSDAGRAFLSATPVEVPQRDGIRIYLPLLDGGDQVGVMVLTMAAVGEDDRRLLRRLASLVAATLTVKRRYTDRFLQARRCEPMSVAAEIQWSLLPPMAMSLPQVEVAGTLEPAYHIAGDSFDYALNDGILQSVVLDAMGHGLDAATMATVAIGAYRHARRAGIGLAEIYAFMDRAIAEQFGPDHFATAQMMLLDTATGRLQWVNAGHPAPLLIRDHKVVQRLSSPTTLPVGFGGEQPLLGEQTLLPGDRVLCFTDGVIEEHRAGEEQFGEEQLIHWVHRIEHTESGTRAVVRALSHVLMQERGGTTSDDATLFLIEWRGGCVGP